MMKDERKISEVDFLILQPDGAGWLSKVASTPASMEMALIFKKCFEPQPAGLGNFDLSYSTRF
jgi:hypothetical protein